MKTSTLIRFTEGDCPDSALTAPSKVALCRLMLRPEGIASRLGKNADEVRIHDESAGKMHDFMIAQTNVFVLMDFGSMDRVNAERVLPEALYKTIVGSLRSKFEPLRGPLAPQDHTPCARVFI